MANQQQQQQQQYTLAPYQRNPANDPTKGFEYENKVRLFTLLNLKDEQRLAVEMKDAPKFDDLVLFIEPSAQPNHGGFYFRQLKHKGVSTKTKTINWDHLFKDENSICYLPHLYNAFRDFREKSIFCDPSWIKELSIMTNIGFDTDTSEYFETVTTVNVWGDMTVLQSKVVNNAQRVKLKDLADRCMNLNDAINTYNKKIKTKIAAINNKKSQDKKDKDEIKKLDKKIIIYDHDISLEFLQLLVFEVNQPNVNEMTQALETKMKSLFPSFEDKEIEEAMTGFALGGLPLFDGIGLPPPPPGSQGKTNWISSLERSSVFCSITPNIISVGLQTSNEIYEMIVSEPLHNWLQFSDSHTAEKFAQIPETVNLVIFICDPDKTIPTIVSMKVYKYLSSLHNNGRSKCFELVYAKSSDQLAKILKCIGKHCYEPSGLYYLVIETACIIDETDISNAMTSSGIVQKLQSWKNVTLVLISDRDFKDGFDQIKKSIKNMEISNQEANDLMKDRQISYHKVTDKPLEWKDLSAKTQKHLLEKTTLFLEGNRKEAFEAWRKQNEEQTRTINEPSSSCWKTSLKSLGLSGGEWLDSLSLAELIVHNEQRPLCLGLPEYDPDLDTMYIKRKIKLPLVKTDKMSEQLKQKLVYHDETDDDKDYYYLCCFNRNAYTDFYLDDYANTYHMLEPAVALRDGCYLWLSSSNSGFKEDYYELEDHVIPSRNSECETDESILLGNTFLGTRKLIATNKLVIVVDLPGNGKTFLLTWLANQLLKEQSGKNELDCLVLRVNLLEVTLSAWKSNILENERGAVNYLVDDLMDFTKCGKAPESSKFLSRTIVKQMCLNNSSSVFLFLDGFDEINDAQRAIIYKLIDGLITNAKGIKRIVLTSRSDNVLEKELTEHFKQFPICLKSFDEEEQTNYLVNRWNAKRQQFGSNNETKERVKNFASKLISYSNKTLKNENGSPIEIPLQCMILSECFFDRLELHIENCKKDPELEPCFEAGNFQLFNLYNAFYEKKVDVLFADKANLLDKNEASGFIKKQLKQSFTTPMQRLSIFHMMKNIPDAEVLCSESWNVYKQSLYGKDLEQARKLGLIQDVDERQSIIETLEAPHVKFIHRTFAEHFFATFLLEKLKGTKGQPSLNENICQCLSIVNKNFRYIYEEVLIVHSEYTGVVQFLHHIIRDTSLKWEEMSDATQSYLFEKRLFFGCNKQKCLICLGIVTGTNASDSWDESLKSLRFDEKTIGDWLSSASLADLAIHHEKRPLCLSLFSYDATNKSTNGKIMLPLVETHEMSEDLKRKLVFCQDNEDSINEKITEMTREARSFHLLKDIGSNGRYLWLKSNQGTEENYNEFKDHVIRSRDSHYGLGDEQQLLKETDVFFGTCSSDNKLLSIIDLPGEGKSLLLTRLTNNFLEKITNNEAQLHRLILLRASLCEVTASIWDDMNGIFNDEAENALDFLVDILQPDRHPLSQAIIKRLCLHNSSPPRFVFILLDGLNEISEGRRNIFFHFTNKLLLATDVSIKRVILTCRPNTVLEERLENWFKQFTICLKEINVEDHPEVRQLSDVKVSDNEQDPIYDRLETAVRAAGSESIDELEKDKVTEPIFAMGMGLLPPNVANTTIAQKAAIVKKISLITHDPARIERAKQSIMRERRPYSEFLIDISSQIIYENESVNARQRMIRHLRHRMDLGRSINRMDDQDSVKRSHYETICELIDEYDPNGICEIYLLLLESRYTLPLFNPLTGEHYLKLLREVSVSTSPTNPPIRLGDDVTLPRVALISCRDRADSQAHEILRSVFHVNTLHANDVADETFIHQALTIDLGIGHVEQRKTNNQSPLLAVHVVHVTGDYTCVMDFLTEFADVLIVEDVPSTSGADSSFCSFISGIGQDSLDNRVDVIRWTHSSGRFSTYQRDANFKKHGFSHLSIEAPNGDRLYNEIIGALHNTLSNLQRKRKPLHTMDLLHGAGITYPVQGIVTFDIEQLLQDNLKHVAQTRSSFVLEKNFCLQYKHEEKKIEYRYDESERKKAESEIHKCVIQRKNDAEKVAKLPLLKFFVQLLENTDPSIRVKAVRKFSQGISARTEIELQQVQQQIGKYHKLVTGDVSANKSEQEMAANKQKYVEAKQKYQDAMLHIEHLWRELSHIYVASPNNSKYQHLPRLAAQHLLDGFSIELLDGDANLLNAMWIKAVFNSLENLLVREKRRIFVLSVMGVQSSGKSTLLNTMFGIKLRTSIGQCTRGINMQLVPVEGRPEYDYVLVLDTEGTRSPDFHGMEGSEKRDNQMATLSILLADATIVVNPGENDAATKEILPIVLMAYQRSKLAEDNGGRLSSMMFFVYHRIDTTQKDKLVNIIRTLSESLQDAFKTARELGGSSVAQQAPPDLPFSHFKLDTSNSSSSDVRILGQNRRSYEPPANVPDPKYGEALDEFRNHIHNRVTQTRDGVSWESRSPVQLSNYLDSIWKCICSADFTSRFADVLDRTKFDQFVREYRSCEQQLASNYRSEFDKLHKSMLKDRSTAADVTANAAIVKKRCEKFQQDLTASVNRTVIELNQKVEQILSQKGPERWKLSYEQKWGLLQRKQLDHWTRQIKYSFHTIFLFDSDLAKLKRDSRQCMKEKASKIDPQNLKNITPAILKSEFDNIVKMLSDETQKKHPPFCVKEAIDNIYRGNPRIKGHKIQVFHAEAELNCKNVFHEHLSGPKIGSTSTEVSKQDLTKRALKWLSSRFSKDDEQQWTLSQHAYELLFQKIHETIKKLVEDMECFDEDIVSVVILRTDSILEEAFLGKTFEYAPRENAHIYARVAITHYLEQKQANWERHNSVAARFTEKKNLDEMYDYFKLVFMGFTKISLFRFHLEKQFEDLSEAFLAEMVCLTTQRVKKAEWLYEIKWTQTYMDRYLLELIDNKSTTELIHYVSKPDELFTHVLRRLIAQTANQELLPAGKDWDEFKNRVKNAVVLATKKALSSKINRAEIFANKLRTRLIDTMRSDVLAKRIDINLGGEYAALDNESDEEFRNACQVTLESVVNNQQELSSREDFLRQVSDLVIKGLRAENHPGAMPRCEASCPLCGSKCIREAGHDTKLLKHDAHHQPGGLAGMAYHKSKTLVPDICSSYEDEKKIYESHESDKVKYIFGDWPNVYPEWEKPHPTQEWPLRQYIFYHYHKDIANHYDRLPCSDVPESYNKDLETIRTTLEWGPIEF